MPSEWTRAELALALVSVDPRGLGGVCLRARHGPVRSTLVDRLGILATPLVRLPPTASDAQLYGAVDIAATVMADRVVREQGLLSGHGTLVLPMAERIGAGLAARLAQVVDEGRHCIVALDEGIDDEALPEALQDRLAFRVDLEGVGVADVTDAAFAACDIVAARARLAAITASPEQVAQLATCAHHLGIDSLRATIFALRTARAHAALFGRDTVDSDDMRIAVEMVLAYRATRLPDAPDPPEPQPEQAPDTEAGDPEDMSIPDDILLEAVRAALPAGLLARLSQGAARHGQGAGTGSRRIGNRRGRPLPARPGRIDGRSRVDLIATLRAAAPWQKIRAHVGKTGAAIHLRAADIHIKRFEQKSDRLLIFTVDASGSAALARLAEAKGAVELLLSEAYARRDHVALVAFRGKGAEVLLSPTRSLVQTKRRLAALPGGGGTPLAAGLKAAMELASAARARGLTPTIALLTDGRANIALDGTPNRVQAASDAQIIARLLLLQRCESIVIDMGNRPEPALKQLSDSLGGIYLPMPRADAYQLSGAVAAALGR